VYTAVVAARPGEKFLDEAVSSIYNQTLAPDSVIVVINGSPLLTGPDKSYISARFTAATVIESSVPHMAHAFNLALKRVKTRYVAFLDADDTWAPDKQAHQVEMLESDGSLNAVCGLTVNHSSRSTGISSYSSALSGRIFGAITFTGLTFIRLGMPDPRAEHFTWLYRWWAMAGASGIRLAHHDDVVLRRRIHESNGWVTDYERGRRQLLTEVRRIHATRENG
jgi:glycosyltransferase involved in cell wall biosynthesis